MTVPPVPVPVPGPHGDDAARVAEALGVDPRSLLDLAATANPVAPDPAPVVARHVEAVHRYPDERRARAALAAAVGVEPERLVLTNGASEAIALVAALHPVGRVDDPEFSLYRRHLRRVSGDGPRWASNPHNPTGRLAGATDAAFVWDEAFFPLSTGRWTRDDGGSIVVGSLTKLLRCPGLRLGYAVARDAGEAARLEALRPRWSVNGLAAEALPELLGAVDLPAWSAAVARLRSDLAAVLARHGFPPMSSDAPWVLVPGAPGLRDALARQGVLVRDCASFGLHDHVRVAVPDEDGLVRLDGALARAGEA